MTCYSDMIVDVSVRLTDWWVESDLVGYNWFYEEFPLLYFKGRPATMNDVIELLANQDRQRSVYMLESISSGLYELMVKDGFL